MSQQETRTTVHEAAAEGNRLLLWQILHGGEAIAKALIDQHNEEGLTALHLAAAGGFPECARLLLEFGANPSSVEADDTGFLPVHLAAQNGHSEMVQLLVEVTNDVEAIDSTERTSLLYAAKGGHVQTCSTLLELGADVNASDCDGWTPLHVAAREGHPSVVQLFMAVGCNLLEVEFELGASNLHLAAEGGHAQVIQLLLQREGREQLAQVDDDGWSALQVAEHHDHAQCVAVLESAVSGAAALTAGGGGGGAPTPASAGPVTCPDGHPTVMISKRYLGWNCDRCENDYEPAQRVQDEDATDPEAREVLVGIRSARCHQCDFDLCENCWVGEGSSAGAELLRKLQGEEGDSSAAELLKKLQGE